MALHLSAHRQTYHNQHKILLLQFHRFPHLIFFHCKREPRPRSDQFPP
uniref:Uncharacterized protein n=1 Tax=Anguilla anguilla TaxID=7936 RepID=A0A0E9WIK8_ANGAN